MNLEIIKRKFNHFLDLFNIYFNKLGSCFGIVFGSTFVYLDIFH